MKKLLLMSIFLVSSLAIAQMQPDIRAWKRIKFRTVYETNSSNLGTDASKINVYFSQLRFRGDWLALAKQCATVYNRHIKNVLCFAYSTGRHLDAALPPRNQFLCWSARYAIINNKIEQERHTQQQLKNFGCPAE